MFDRSAGRPLPDTLTTRGVTRSAPIAGHEIPAPAHVGAGMHAHAALASAETDPDGSATPGASDPRELGGAAPGAEGTPLPRDAIAALIRGGRHREALTACAREHGAVLGRLCMALLGSQADADEATQETLLRAHRAMASYRGDGSVKAWLCGIARHVCAHVLETRRRGRDVVERAGLTDDTEPTQPIHDAAAHHRAHAIRRGLAALRPSEREALVLRYVADLGHRDIAGALQIDEAAARKRISRALAQLRTVMCDLEIARRTNR
ncbi:MAG: RNA polymerase sigma factor [Deltaproteobacteria bacterium]|nr:MAG: RNA polymerase sigma factor [Deltaproteobacteria bacterium]